MIDAYTMGRFNNISNNFTLTRHDHWHIFSAKNTAFNSVNSTPLTNKQLLESPIEITSSKNTHVFKGKIWDNDITVFLKQYVGRGPAEKVKNIFRTHRGIKEVTATLLIQSLGFIAPTILQFGYRKTFFFTTDHYLLTKELDNFVNLYQAVELFKDHKQFSKQALISSLATKIGHFHLHNLSHGDLRPGNIMVTNQDAVIEIAFLDNERTRKHKILPAKLRIKNLVQLNMIISDQISVHDRLKFFILYCRAAQIQNRRDLLQKIERKTRKRLSRLVRLGRLKQEEVFL